MAKKSSDPEDRVPRGDLRHRNALAKVALAVQRGEDVERAKKDLLKEYRGVITPDELDARVEMERGQLRLIP
jgi:hypothetical protein